MAKLVKSQRSNTSKKEMTRFYTCTWRTPAGRLKPPSSMRKQRNSISWRYISCICNWNSFKTQLYRYSISLVPNTLFQGLIWRLQIKIHTSQTCLWDNVLNQYSGRASLLVKTAGKHIPLCGWSFCLQSYIVSLTQAIF